jgi:molybdopterin converting factor small subunit
MLTVTLSAGLASLVPPDALAAGPNRRTLRVDADDWPGAVAALRAAFPHLAERVLTEAGTVRPGFLVVVNDVVGETAPLVRPGDELFFLAQISGG